MCTLASGGLGGSGGLAGAVEAVGVGAGSGSTAEAKEIGEVVAGTVTGEAAETEGQQQEQTQQGQTQAQAQGQAQGQTQQTQQQQGKVQQHQGQGRLNANAPADCTQLFFNPDSGERMSRNLKHKVRQLLRKEEVRRFGSEDFLSLDEDDVEFVCQTVWRCRYEPSISMGKIPIKSSLSM
ncbi:hypothetical protein B484DRAFT_484557 [Ochromonadaceae sp. CCMP2298]|nr:hypothetical protein B484DRAFT_484557 [Ochromonadaceae sp. CCMP2298]